MADAGSTISRALQTSASVMRPVPRLPPPESPGGTFGLRRDAPGGEGGSAASVRRPVGPPEPGKGGMLDVTA
jgi:hypothetical protein